MRNQSQEKRLNKIILSASLILSSIFAIGQAAAESTGPYDQFSEDPTQLSFDTPINVYPNYSSPTSTYDSLESFIPTSIIIEHYGQQKVKDMGSHISSTNLYLTAPILKPQDAKLGKWNFDIKTSVRITWFDKSGRSFLGESNLYTVGLQASAIRSIFKEGQLILGMAPQISSDFNLLSHDIFYFGAYIAYAQSINDDFKFTIGLSYMPRYYDDSILPLLGLNWKVSDNYELRVEAARLSLINVSNDRFEWGPFAQLNTSVWTVNNEGTTKQMQQNSTVIGFASQFSMGDKNSTSYHIIADIGAIVENEIKFQSSNGKHTLETFKTETGLYVRLGFEIRY